MPSPNATFENSDIVKIQVACSSLITLKRAFYQLRKILRADTLYFNICKACHENNGLAFAKAVLTFFEDRSCKLFHFVTIYSNLNRSAFDDYADC